MIFNLKLPVVMAIAVVAVDPISEPAITSTTTSLALTAGSLAFDPALSLPTTPVFTAVETLTGTSTMFVSGASAGASAGTSSNSSPIRRKPTEAIIGGVIGGLILISLLLSLFFFYYRRNNKRSQALSDTASVPSNIVNPFTVTPSNPTSTFLPQSYTSNGQSLPSQSILQKFIQRGQPFDPASTSSNGVFPPLTPPLPQFSSPTFISPSSSLLPLTGSQTNFDGTKTIVPQVATEPSRQRCESPSPQRATNPRYLQHEDSGVRIPPTEDDLVELPPLYTLG